MMQRPNPLMLDRLGRVLHVGDAIILLNTFPAIIKDFVVRDGELGAIIQRSAGMTGFAYFEEIERRNNNTTFDAKFTEHPNQEKVPHEQCKSVLRSTSG